MGHANAFCGPERSASAAPARHEQWPLKDRISSISSKEIYTELQAPALCCVTEHLSIEHRPSCRPAAQVSRPHISRREKFRNLALRARFNGYDHRHSHRDEGHRTVSETKAATATHTVLLVWSRSSWPVHVLKPFRSNEYIVHEAFSAKDACDALTAIKIDVMIADLILRDDCGFRFSGPARELSPTTKVRLTSSPAFAYKIADELCAGVSPSRRHCAPSVDGAEREVYRR
jgi:hypothetical protein